jgi:hypothetical protein
LVSQSARTPSSFSVRPERSQETSASSLDILPSARPTPVQAAAGGDVVDLAADGDV